MKLTVIRSSRIFHYFLAIVACTVMFSVSAQQDFNNFQTLVAQGEIPDDFVKTSREKVNEAILENRSEISSAKRKVFAETTNYGIDQILHSGLVVYGDEISQYIQAVANNLLKDEPELLANLRFYTIKSNEANALSTDQGIIFVTTGLISQLTSEAQLAFILSHEIVHYEEKHVIETFDLKRTISNKSKRILQLSNFSKENEFEADKKALKRYSKAGYDLGEIISTFDVLMYSYLPFDEVEFPNTYYSSDKMYIPESFFASKEYPIIAEEDYNDEYSSHPNIKKRKEAILLEMINYEAGDLINSLGENTFVNIRTIARFETVHTYVIDGEFAKALYAIFLLECQFPKSLYLDRMKAQCWFGLVRLDLVGGIGYQGIPELSSYEGESASLFYFLENMDGFAVMTLGLRMLYDLYKENEKDVMIRSLLDRFIQLVIDKSDFKWSSYSFKNFHESAVEARNFVFFPENTDSLKSVDSIFEKIEIKKNNIDVEDFDSSKFYVYGLSDIVLDSNFRTYFKTFKRVDENLQKLEYSQSSKEFNKIYGEIDIDTCILVDPNAIYVMKEKMVWSRVDLTESMMKAAFLKAATNRNIVLRNIAREDFKAFGTQHFNDRNQLFILLAQTINNSFDCVPVDDVYLNGIGNRFGSSKVVFSNLIYFQDVTQDNVLMVDLKTGKVNIDVGISNPREPSLKENTAFYTDLLQRLQIKRK
ncbi:MAG: M48 family metallopeptidase [Fluviicola sp.]|nr:M48 family metallopeptidase [Fluviicola sp.]